MRPARLTPEHHARLRRVAELQLQTESIKRLSIDLRVTPNYLRQLLSKKRKQLSNEYSVPRGA